MEAVIVYVLLALAGLLVWKAGFDAGKRSESPQRLDAVDIERLREAAIYEWANNDVARQRVKRAHPTGAA